MSPQTPTNAAAPWTRGSSVLSFYLWAFGISWCGFGLLLARSSGLRFFQSPLWLAALVLPAVGPAAAAAIAGSSPRPAEGTTRPTAPGRPSFPTPVSARWWAVTVSLPLGIMLAASLLTLAFQSGHHPLLRHVSPSNMLLFSLMSLAANPLEEIGWRGVAQTRLQETVTPLQAASLVGLLWAVWHIPLFFLSTTPVSMSETPFWPWAAGVVPQAILLAWLYNRTGRSLATVSVFHILGNLAGYLLDSSIFMVSALRILCALIVVWRAGSRLGYPASSARSSP